MSDAAARGYAHPAYAAALAEIGRPRRLSHSDGWVLERPIPGTDLHDAVGCYPLFACARWDGLERDVRELTGVVSLTLVTDPFGAYDAALLARCFPDRCVAFKEHFVTDLRRPDDAIVSRHHRRNVLRARRAVDVEVCARPLDRLDDWAALYAHLVRRHDVRGPAAFSRRSLAAQLAVPGIVALRADRGGETVGMTLWYERDDVADYHLGAYSEAGYAHGAASAIFAAALAHFRDRVRWLALGAGAGVASDGEDGLSRFKRGWATGTRTAYLCGRVLDAPAYAALAPGHGAGVAPGYFPAYRADAAASR